MPEPKDVRAAVTAAVEAAGLPLTDAELDAFISIYPALRAGADSLYIEAVRYEEPALVFTPVPPVQG